MKICLVYEYYFPHVGGGEVLTQHLAEGLVSRGHECVVVTARLPGTAASEELNGVRIRRVRVPRQGDRYWFTLRSYPAIAAAARESDIIQVATYNGAPAAWLAGRRWGRPVVLFPFEVLDGLWMEVGLNPAAAAAFRMFEKSVLSLPYDAYSCISRYSRSRLLKMGIPAERVFLAYPGVDHRLFNPGAGGGSDKTRRRLGVDKGDFLCMYTGRPGVVKGVEYLIRSFPEIRRRIPRAKLLLILSRQPASRYKQTLKLISRLETDGIILHDQVPRKQLPLYFQASDCVVVPSLNEGFGFTCVEACSMDRPVVVTDAGSLPEVVYGRYVTVQKRDPAALAAGVEKVFHGQYQVSRPRRYRWQENVDRHLEAYTSLVSGEGVPAQEPAWAGRASMMNW